MKNPVWKSGLPYPDHDRMLSPEGMSRVLAHDGRDDLLPFLNDCAITVYKNKLYLAWYNSTNTEIGGSSLIRGRWSDDEGLSWSAPFRVVGEANFDEEHFVPPSLFVHEGKLYAVVTRMGHNSLTDQTDSLDLYVMRDENDWRKVSALGGGLVMTAAPVLMDNGCYAAGVWMSKRDETPSFAAVFISQGMDIEKPWRCVPVYDPLLPGALDLRCAEIGIIVDGAQITAYVRDDIGHPGDPSGGGHAYVFVSSDYGESWSPPVLMDNRIGNAKLYAGKLSSGCRYVIYNDDRGFFDRSLLLIAATEPGEMEYTKVYKVFEDGIPEFGGRGYRWFYPCSIEYKGRLYIACTMEEAGHVRSAAVARIPVESL
ncbi:MAG: glycoside hydrolase [Oscillospiraceae bacterium]|jgi:hypothetical protein|nr:glycoside hydrolase [Oscillospiraceae bacterium]